LSRLASTKILTNSPCVLQADRQWCIYIAVAWASCDDDDSSLSSSSTMGGSKLVARTGRHPVHEQAHRDQGEHQAPKENAGGHAWAKAAGGRYQGARHEERVCVAPLARHGRVLGRRDDIGGGAGALWAALAYMAGTRSPFLPLASWTRAKSPYDLYDELHAFLSAWRHDERAIIRRKKMMNQLTWLLYVVDTNYLCF
jgi:hypothetical protein